MIMMICPSSTISSRQVVLKEGQEKRAAPHRGREADEEDDFVVGPCLQDDKRYFFGHMKRIRQLMPYMLL